MVYLLGTDAADKPAGARFRDLLDRPGILQMPGAHNGMAALQATRAGFDALYLSGAAMTASMGLPDLGIITIEEVCVLHPPGLARRRPAGAGRRRHRLWRGAQCHAHGAHLRGGGRRAVHIEDQLLPKKCGHLNDKKLADARDMAAKVAAAAQGAARSLSHRADRRRGERGHGRRGSARKAVPGGGRRRDLPRGDDTAEMFREFAGACPACRCSPT